MSRPGIKVPKRKFVVSAIVLLTILVSWSGYIERKTEAYVDSATVQALAAFATARILNRVITTAASVQVEGSAVIGSMSIRPFELLDPLHDVVERYSVVMEMAIVSLVTQKLLIELTAAASFKLLLTVLGVLLVVSLFINEGRHSNWLFRIFIILAFVRFLFVLAVATSAILDQAYMNKETERNLSYVQVTAAEFEQLEPAFELSQDEKTVLTSRLDELERQVPELTSALLAAESGLSQLEKEVRAAESKVESIKAGLSRWETTPFTKNEALIEAREELSQLKDRRTQQRKQLEAATRAHESAMNEVEDIIATLQGKRSADWLENFLSRAKGMLDVDRFDGLYERVTNIIPNILNLIALFLLKTLFMPLLFLMLLLRGFRYIWGIDLRDFGRSVTAEVRNELRMTGANEERS